MYRFRNPALQLFHFLISGEPTEEVARPCLKTCKVAIIELGYAIRCCVGNSKSSKKYSRFHRALEDVEAKFRCAPQRKTQICAALKHIMTRHGKNATASSVYSYHERKKDTQQSNYGTRSSRMGKDSVKDFDACCLTLQLCRNPVVTPQGYLYEKEAILEYIVHQKRLIAKQMKEYEKQKHKEEKELKELAEAENRSKVESFMKSEKSIVSKSLDSFEKKTVDTKNRAKDAATSSSTSDDSKEKNLPSFWIPSLTPQANKDKVAKPDSKVYCPMSKKPLKLKDLIPVKFTPIADRDKKTSVIAKKDRWMCAVTHDTLGNFIPCAVLRPTGDVVTMECVEKIIRKNNMQHPINGQLLKEKDIIPLDRGGTGFASTNKDLDAKKYTPVMMVA
ncbi:unnamed protein product [Clavelina lepadiformis]|uniref:Nitric oxide synthase-interacting protein n=1 Tax=Clavelina lepadiformis TaxID=159417 RepID=A0ABP0GGJ4_CLALP